jgi:hypothetical protein
MGPILTKDQKNLFR